MYEKLIVMRAKKKQKDILHVTYAGQGEFYLLNVIRTYICLSFLYSHLKISDLIVHLQSVHDYPVEVEQLHFPAITEFLSWKADEEKKMHSAYVQECAPRTFDTTKHWYYCCNRSGVYRNRNTGMRNTKSQGSSKIGERCIAHMKAIQNFSSGEVVVHYCRTHHNHEQNIGHLRLQHTTRMKVAAELQQGVTIGRIIDNVRDCATGGITREHLITRQDIHNIKNHYNIEGIIRHTNDLTSVCAWVEEMRALPYNPILLFKPQGATQPQDMDNVGIDDFILGIQTEFQKDMLLGLDKCVCIDSTHGTNMYDFNLITVLVIDGFGEGIPVAWAIANREDVTMLIEFLKAIKKRTGHLKPQWFMSDDANQYFNAWKGVFGGDETTKLLCAWHVDRAWRTALLHHIDTKQSRIVVYHQLRILLMENQEASFRQLLQQFISFLDANEERFSKYFKENYCNRLCEWASCFRRGSVVNTNMFVESFHRTLKVVYLEHKQNRRIDVLLHVLLKLSRDKVFEQLTKMEKGKYSHRVTEINKRHRESEKMEPLKKHIRAINDKTWSVPSAKDGAIRYTVELVTEECDCSLRCSTCAACVHMYTCSCMDSTLHATVCKHVHIIKMTSSSTSVKKCSPATSHPNDKLKYFTNLLSDKVQATKLETQRQKLLTKINEISVLVNECESTDALKMSSSHPLQ